MNLLSDYIFKPIIRFVINLIKGVITFAFRQIGAGLKHTWPYVVRLALIILKDVLFAMSLAIVGAFTTNLPQRIAEHWSDDAIARGIPQHWVEQIRPALSGFAILTIVAGWVILLLLGFTAIDWLFSP